MQMQSTFPLIYIIILDIKGWANRGGNWNGPGAGGGPRWNNGNQGGRSFNRGGGGGGRNQPLPPGHKHMLVDVPANKCGLVIGKGIVIFQNYYSIYWFSQIPRQIKYLFIVDSLTNPDPIHG